MKLLTLLQIDTLQVASETNDGIYFLIIVAIVAWLIWSVITFIKMFKKAEKSRRAQEENIKIQKIEQLDNLKDKMIPYFKIKGVTSYELKKPGCYICRIVAEPENPYDMFAVKIEHPTLGIIGHLPKDNIYIHNLAKKKDLYGAVEIGIYKKTPFARLYIDPAIFSSADIANMESLTIKE